MFTNKNSRFKEFFGDHIDTVLKFARTKIELCENFGISNPEFIEVNFQVEEVSNESESDN